MSLRGLSLLAMTVALLFTRLAHAAPRDIQIRSVDLQARVIELFNFGSTDQALDGWRFCTHDENQSRVYSSPGGLAGVVVGARTAFFIHLANDAPDSPDAIDVQTVGPFAGPLDTGPFAIGLYFAPAIFSDPGQVADHLQWSLDGAHDNRADERSGVAESGGVWTARTSWIATDANTVKIRLTDTGGGVLHGPANYETIGPPAGAAFLRGDANSDGGVDISDAVFTLIALFRGGPDPACGDSADVNDDGVINLTDPVALLSFLFRAGSPPPPPGPSTPGPDPTPDGFLCTDEFAAIGRS